MRTSITIQIPRTLTNNNSRGIRFNLALALTLSFLTLLISGHFSNLAAQAAIPLEGLFSTGNWQVRLDDKSGTGVFTGVGSSSRKAGEPFLKVRTRSSYNTWRGRAFDLTFSTVQESTISIDGNTLVITPKTGPAYVLTRVRTTVSAAKSATGSSGIAPAGYSAREKSDAAPARSSEGGDCGTVQCHGITKAGNRCRRITTNCSGRCYQH